MAFTKEERLTFLTPKLLFLYLILYPLGQLGRIDLLTLGSRLTINLIDIIPLLFLLLFPFVKLVKPKFYKTFKALIFLMILSDCIALSYLPLSQVLVGSLYLIRLASYFVFFMFVANYCVTLERKRLVINSLLLACVGVALFGWLQYHFFFDLRPMKYFGWDDHLGRLVGTLFDPGFTGIVLALGTISAVTMYLTTKKVGYALVSLFLFITTFYTYSRASYLALLGGLLTTLVIVGKKTKLYLGIVAVSVIIILLLPQPASSGVQLWRLFSVFARVTNYQETLIVFSKSPLFGVGYNMMCAARMHFLEPSTTLSHSCSGADSSLLLVLATTGVVGFVIFLNLIYEIVKSVDDSIYAKIFMSSSVAVIISSLFVNSMFYPWVMGWMFLLLATASAKTIQKKLP